MGGTGPVDRCGFELEPGDLPEGVADEFEADSDKWYEYSDGVGCWRKACGGADSGRCIWHAETDDKSPDALVDARADNPERLDGAYIPAVEFDPDMDIDFEGCGLLGATFDGTNLLGTSFINIDGRAIQFLDAQLAKTQFFDAALYKAEFRNTSLSRTQFPYVNLQRVQFSATELHGARFAYADLRNAAFENVNLRYAEFPNAILGGDHPGRFFSWPRLSLPGPKTTQFLKVDIRDTSFDSAYMDIGIADKEGVEFNGGTVFGRSHHELNGEWERAARAYRSLQQTLSNHALMAKVRKHRVREKHARRLAAVPLHPIQWLKLDIARWVALYGESPYRIVGMSLLVIAVSALAYPRWGLVVNKANSPLAKITYPLGSGELWYGLGKSLYFSVITFTTLGYGDIQPLGFGEAVATAESFLGALLMALLVYVLGRRATW